MSDFIISILLFLLGGIIGSLISVFVFALFEINNNDL